MHTPQAFPPCWVMSTTVSRLLQGLLGPPGPSLRSCSSEDKGCVLSLEPPPLRGPSPPWQSTTSWARAALPIVPRWRVCAVRLLGVGADRTKMMLLMMMTAAFYVY